MWCRVAAFARTVRVPIAALTGTAGAVVSDYVRVQQRHSAHAMPRSPLQHVDSSFAASLHGRYQQHHCTVGVSSTIARLVSTAFSFVLQHLAPSWTATLTLTRLLFEMLVQISLRKHCQLQGCPTRPLSVVWTPSHVRQTTPVVVKSLYF